MDPLDQYYRNNYSINCKPQTYISTTEFYTTACHTGSFFMILFSSYALYLMIKVSPPSMQSFVPYMIHLHCWTMLCDFMFSIMICPYFYFPLLAGVPLGLFAKINISFLVQMWFGFAALGGMACSIITMFEQRHRVIVDSSIFVMRRTPTRVIFNVFFYGYHINFGLPELLTVPQNQNELKLEFLKIVPCPPSNYFGDEMVIIQKDGSLFNPHMYFTCFSISCLASFYIFHTFWNLHSISNPNMSTSTRRLQRNFFISSTIQVAIPVCIILAPNIYWNLSITFQFYSQEGNNLSVICFTLHGVSASIATIFLYKPYRDFTFRLLFHRILKMKTTITAGTSRFVTVTSSHRAILQLEKYLPPKKRGEKFGQ